MRSLMKFGLAGVGVIAMLAQAHAETMDFHLKNSTGKAIQVRMFSQTRVWQWPSATTAYDQKNKKTASYPITCNAGEKVCYGAWPTKKPTSWGWGAGPAPSEPEERVYSGGGPRNKPPSGGGGAAPAGKMTCTACCYTCGANTGV